MGHLVVECTLSTYADVHAPIGTQLQTLPEFYWHVCVCATHIWRKMHVYPYLPHWAEGDRTESEGRYTLVCLRVATAHLVMPAWKGQLQVAGFAAINFTTYGEGVKKKKRIFQFLFFSPPVSIIGRRPKQSNKLNIHLSLAVLHNSVGEAGWKDFFVCFV